MAMMCISRLYYSTVNILRYVFVRFYICFRISNADVTSHIGKRLQFCSVFFVANIFLLSQVLNSTDKLQYLHFTCNDYKCQIYWLCTSLTLATSVISTRKIIFSTAQTSFNLCTQVLLGHLIETHKTWVDAF